jgi:nitrogen PTS system EIIA component
MKNSFDYLAPSAIVAQCNAASTKAVFQLIGQIAEREYGLSAESTIEGLVERERLGSTGFGAGIAIPHARSENLDRVVGAFIQLETGIDFGAVDGLPVDLFFCLISPADAGSLHLKALAHTSRWLRDRSFVAKLRGAESSEALYALFDGVEARDAA